MNWKISFGLSTFRDTPLKVRPPFEEHLKSSLSKYLPNRFIFISFAWFFCSSSCWFCCCQSYSYCCCGWSCCCCCYSCCCWCCCSCCNIYCILYILHAACSFLALHLLFFFGCLCFWGLPRALARCLSLSLSISVSALCSLMSPMQIYR